MIHIAVRTLFLLLILITGSKSISLAADAPDVNFTITGAYGTVNDYFLKDTYYLFVPQDITLSDTAICSDQMIISATEGSVSEDGYSLIGDFRNKDEIQITLEDQSTVSVVLLQSGLPSICIDLNGITQEEINAGSKETKYPGNDIYVTNADGSINAQTDEANQIEIKGRGNSSWTFPKRSYQIKFDKKTGLLGMTKAKKWILLAADDDASLLRDRTAFSLASSLGLKGTPGIQKVDLWIDGEYQGNYSLCQKIDTNASSLDLSDEGILAELDNMTYQSEEHVFTTSLNNHYVLKEYNSTDEEALQYFGRFTEKIESFEDALYAKEKNWEEISSYIDEASWAYYYLIQEFSENIDAMITSTYFYTDGSSDEIHIGPVWDMGCSMGNYKSQTLYHDYVINGYYRKERATYYTELMKIKEFRSLVRSIFEERFKDAVETCEAKLQQDAADMEDSAYMNYIRWPGRLGKLCVNRSCLSYKRTYQENVTVLSDWLKNRILYMGPFDEGQLPEQKISLDNTVYTYDGKVKTPKVTIPALKEGYDYEVLYSSGRVKAGTYTVTIKGVGRYTGAIKKSFRIIPVAAKLKSIQSRKKDILIRADSAPSTKGGSAYQIGYKKKGSKSWKYVTCSQSYKRLTGLKNRNYYYFRVRAYKTVSGQKYYGAWSKSKLYKVRYSK